MKSLFVKNMSEFFFLYKIINITNYVTRAKYNLFLQEQIIVTVVR